MIRGARDHAAAELLVQTLPQLPIRGPVLVVGDPLPFVAESLEATAIVREWSRYSSARMDGAAWPDGGPYGSMLVRVSKDKRALGMMARAAASLLRTGGSAFFYGANDEGIRSISSALSPWFASFETIATGSRCRVVVAEKVTEANWAEGLSDFRMEVTLPDPRRTAAGGEERHSWITYPGVFGKGNVDPATTLLVRTLEEAAVPATLTAQSAVLDFGCGSGVLAAFLASCVPELEPYMSDYDAIALAAAEENVPSGRAVLADGWPSADRLPITRLDLIVSNPPYHVGKEESTEIIEALVDGALGTEPPHLSTTGSLWVVVQRRLPIAKILEAGFRSVESVADDGPFRVWHAREPRQRR